MERRKSENITDVLLRYLRQEGLETPLAQHRAIDAWPKVVGALVAEHTTEIYIHAQTLYVRIDTPSLRANLMMNRTHLLALINKQAGMTVVCDLVIR